MQNFKDLLALLHLEEFSLPEPHPKDIGAEWEELIEQGNKHLDEIMVSAPETELSEESLKHHQALEGIVKRLKELNHISKGTFERLGELMPRISKLDLPSDKQTQLTLAFVKPMWLDERLN